MANPHPARLGEMEMTAVNAHAPTPVKTQPAPTPWDDASQYPEFASIRIFSGTRYVATVGNSDDTKEQTKANAAHIVHCVNTHAALVAALESLCSGDATYANDTIVIQCSSHSDAIQRMAKARDALRAAALAQTQPTTPDDPA